MDWPFRAWGAHVVLAGHQHVYERIVDPQGGGTYIVNGLGGHPWIYDVHRCRDVETGSEVRFNKAHGALLVHVPPAEAGGSKPARGCFFSVSEAADAGVDAPPALQASVVDDFAI